MVAAARPTTKNNASFTRLYRLLSYKSSTRLRYAENTYNTDKIGPFFSRTYKLCCYMSWVGHAYKSVAEFRPQINNNLFVGQDRNAGNCDSDKFAGALLQKLVFSTLHFLLIYA